MACLPHVVPPIIFPQIGWQLTSPGQFDAPKREFATSEAVECPLGSFPEVGLSDCEVCFTPGTDISGLNDTVLRHIDDCQHSLEQNSARFLRQRIEGGFDKGSSSSLPFALHKHQQHSMNFFSASSPPRFKIGASPFESHSQRLIKLGVYSINPEHDLLLDDATYCYQNQPRPTFGCQKRLHAFDPCQWRFCAKIFGGRR